MTRARLRLRRTAEPVIFTHPLFIASVHIPCDKCGNSRSRVGVCGWCSNLSAIKRKK